MSTEPQPRPAALEPAWFTRLAQVMPGAAPPIRRRLPPQVLRPGRRAAVLMLFGPNETGEADRANAQVLLTQRALSLRAHPGEVAFPGGRLDPGEDEVGAALREAQEETGLDPAGVQVRALGARLQLNVSDQQVCPVLAWWQQPGPVAVRDPNEVLRVAMVPVADLVAPENRFTVWHPSGYRGPAFVVHGMLIWGFTAGILAWSLHLAGIEEPWDPQRLLPLPMEPVVGDEQLRRLLAAATGGAAVIDIALLALILVYAYAGYRQGAVVGLLSLGGFLGCALLAALLLPALAAGMAPGPQRAALVLLGVVGVAWLGQFVGATIGSTLRRLVPEGPAARVDQVIGALAGVVAVATVIWFVAGAMRGGPSGLLSRAVADSQVIQAVDELMPQELAGVADAFREVVSSSDFPRVFAGVAPEQIAPVQAPDSRVMSQAELRRVKRSIVKITGSASCGRGQEGSGAVVAPNRVVTNAHVVAGVARPTVQLPDDGRTFQAVVVAFDPRRDVAVLLVPDLVGRVLPLGSDLERGDPAVVAGYPNDGPYRAQNARVRQILNAVGEDIYQRPGVQREVYSLYVTVEPGNSGGPVLDKQGRVVGLVFAKSLDDTRTGYALTMDEVRPVLNEGLRQSQPVSSGSCTST